MTSSQSTAPALQIRDIEVAFRVRPNIMDSLKRRPVRKVFALDDVTTQVGKRQTLGIVGESGCGKSTLAKAVVGLVKPTAGEILVDGTNVLAANRRELRAIRRRVQLIYQDPASSLNPRLSVGDAIMEAPLAHGLVQKSDRDRRLAELLDQVGLSEKVAKRRPRALSGGQRQRVAIARALALEPDTIIADEITSALDVSVQAQIVNLLKEMQRELGLTIVFISHDLPLVGHIADHVAVMYLGRVVESGSVMDVFTEPAHPYTVGLLGAQPSRSRRKQEGSALKGEIPSPLHIPSGCRFRTRCKLAQEKCSQLDPAGHELNGTHISWCHFADQARSRSMAALRDGEPADLASGF